MFKKKILLATALLLSTYSFYAVADSMRNMGNQYGRMLLNLFMVEHLQQKCTDLRSVTIQDKTKVDELLRSKIDSDVYAAMMVQMADSGIEEVAQSQVKEIWSKLEGCDDPRLESVLEYIETTHAEAFSNLDKTTVPKSASKDQ